MDLPKEAKRAPSSPVWNQSFPSPMLLITYKLLIYYYYNRNYYYCTKNC